MSKMNEFFRACERGDLKAIEKFVPRFGVDGHDDNFHTAIQVAAANDQRSTVVLLLSLGADLSSCNWSGWSALHHACFHGHTDMCKILIKAGAKVGATNRFGATPINVAAASGHLSTVRLLLGAGATINEEIPAQFSNCPMPMATAALYGRESVLRAFIELQGWNAFNRDFKARPILKPQSYSPTLINAPTPGSQLTPLMFAAAATSVARHGSKKPLAQMLIDRGGADPDRINALGATALDVADACQNSEVRAYLEGKTTAAPPRAAEAAEDEFFEAVRDGDLDHVATFLSDSTLDVNASDSSGGTALMLAAACGHADIVELLIRLSADVDAQDSVNGWTALMQAVFYSHREVAQLLIRAGADPTLTANNGSTALDLATLMEKSDTQLLRMLAEVTVKTAPPTFVRSMSSSALDLVGKKEGLRGWWDKVSSRFRRLKHDQRVVSVNIIPDEDNSENETVDKLTVEDVEATAGMDGAVFTLGFTAATTDLSSYLVAPISPPDGKGNVANMSDQINFDIPKGTEKRNKHRLPKSRHQRPRKKPSLIDKRKSIEFILKSLSLDKYIGTFEREEIDLEALRELTDDDLKELGILDRGARAAILQAAPVD